MSYKKDVRANPRKAEVWIVKNLEYGPGNNMKTRPVVIAGSGNGKVRYCKCTTVYHVGNVEILDNIPSNLHEKTYINPEIYEMDVSRLGYRLGELGTYDKDRFGAMVRGLSHSEIGGGSSFNGGFGI